MDSKFVIEDFYNCISLSYVSYVFIQKVQLLFEQRGIFSYPNSNKFSIDFLGTLKMLIG